MEARPADSLDPAARLQVVPRGRAACGAPSCCRRGDGDADERTGRQAGSHVCLAIPTSRTAREEDSSQDRCGSYPVVVDVLSVDRAGRRYMAHRSFFLPCKHGVPSPNAASHSPPSRLRYTNVLDERCSLLCGAGAVPVGEQRRRWSEDSVGVRSWARRQPAVPSSSLTASALSRRPRRPRPPPHGWTRRSRSSSS